MSGIFLGHGVYVSVADAGQVGLLPVASSTPSGNQGDRLSQYSVRMFNGDGVFDNKPETYGNDSNAVLVNGGTDHDVDIIPNNASHFRRIGSTPDSQNNSVQR